MISILNAHKEVTFSLITAKADVNRCFQDGSTPLMAAAYNGDVRTIVTLVKAGAQLNTKNGEGSTATAIFMERYGGDLASLLRKQNTSADGSVKSKVKQAIAARAANFQQTPDGPASLGRRRHTRSPQSAQSAHAPAITRSRSDENRQYKLQVGSGVSVSRDLEADEVIIKRSNKNCIIS